MTKRRFVYHPILTSPKGLAVFIPYLITAVLVGGFLNVSFNRMIAASGLVLHDPALDLSVMERILLSQTFRIWILPLVALIGTGLTATFIRGPIHRMEGWLARLDHGFSIPPLVIRSVDKFNYLVSLLNEVRSRLEKKKKS